jgi:ferredoxin
VTAVGKKTTTMAVDMIACAGHGICAELLPEWIRLDDWGYPIIRREAVPPELMTQARWAVGAGFFATHVAVSASSHAKNCDAW